MSRFIWVNVAVATLLTVLTMPKAESSYFGNILDLVPPVPATAVEVAVAHLLHSEILFVLAGFKPVGEITADSMHFPLVEEIRDAVENRRLHNPDMHQLFVDRESDRIKHGPALLRR